MQTELENNGTSVGLIDGIRSALLSGGGAAHYPMDNCDVINIGLRIIKQCKVYCKEYKNWPCNMSATWLP